MPDPKPVTPLWDLVLGFVFATLIAAMAWYGGSLDGQAKAWVEQDQLLRDLTVANAALQQANAFQVSIEPWAYLFNCDSDPVANNKRWDETRTLLLLACPPDIVVPEEEI